MGLEDTFCFYIWRLKCYKHGGCKTHGGAWVRLTKILSVLPFILLAASIARPDGIPDSQLNINRGPNGSPPLQGTTVITTDANGNATQEFTLQNGTVTSVVFSMPAIDWIAPFVCGPSNAFVNQSLVPSSDGNNLVCTYTVGPTDPGEGSEEESISTMENDCRNFNLGLGGEADDCAGIPSGTDQSDAIYTVFNAKAFSTATATAVGVPEPGTLGLLMLGFASLPLVRRKLSQ
jgi:hypothetical protein